MACKMHKIADKKAIQFLTKIEELNHDSFDGLRLLKALSTIKGSFYLKKISACFYINDDSVKRIIF
ncbi:hypothetical protein BpHYR1_027724 [Brachionus plicatilis]|uniref:Uncharacterized protein n=1 Tax=Brachionus plicatilis TaxID=10195 RepID=A0A3M7SLC4_BRAPC|nr:hypothetical protein BpHYR1_027724 [Brachionus plicatilis]